MSVRETLVKHMSTILRSSNATIMALLSDENGLSIAKTGRQTDLDLDPSAITSVATASFSSSEENWYDLGIIEQKVAFSFFEKICLITVRIANTLLTIVHDYNTDWPLDADSIASSLYHLRREIDIFFGKGDISTQELEKFSSDIRSSIYLCGMGSEVDFLSYKPSNFESQEQIQNISNILDSVQNPVFYRYGLVNSSGMTIDARDVRPDDFPINIAAFSANANVGFQKMKKEAKSMNVGRLVLYMCVSGMDADNLAGILCAPSGKIQFIDEQTGSEIIQPITFFSLFPLEYGGLPIICEARNIVNSIVEVLGEDSASQKFVTSATKIVQSKYQ